MTFLNRRTSRESQRKQAEIHALFHLSSIQLGPRFTEYGYARNKLFSHPVEIKDFSNKNTFNG